MSDLGQNYTDRPESVEPARFATEEEKTQIEMYDSLVNLITGLGTAYDKSSGGHFEQQQALRYDHSQLTALYRENWIAGKLVDAVPDDMTRAWRTLSSDDLPPEKKEEFEDLEAELKVRFYFNQAHKMARLYGGAVIVLDIQDGEDPKTEFNIARMKKGQLRHMKVVDLTRIIPGPHIITNPLDPMYGQPEYYRFAESGIEVHHSRLIRFDGIRIPFQEYRRNNYWNDSILNRLYQQIKNLELVIKSSASLVYESNIDVVKIAALRDYLQDSTSTNLLIKRLQLQKHLKATTNQTVIDQEDDYVNITKQFTGLPSLIDRYLVMLTAGSDTPAGRILGDSASAFDVSGSGADLKNYYDGVRSGQIIEYTPKLKHLDKILAVHLGWNDKYDLKFEWNSLFQKDPEEEARAEKARAEVYSLLQNNHVLTPADVAEELRGNPYFSTITLDKIEELKKQVQFELDLENEKKILTVDAQRKSLEQMDQVEQDPEGESEEESDKDKEDVSGKGVHGKPDPKKQIRSMKPEGSKEIKAKNKEARSRGTDKE